MQWMLLDSALCTISSLCKCLCNGLGVAEIGLQSCCFSIDATQSQNGPNFRVSSLTWSNKQDMVPLQLACRTHLFCAAWLHLFCAKHARPSPHLERAPEPKHQDLLFESQALTFLCHYQQKGAPESLDLALSESWNVAHYQHFNFQRDQMMFKCTIQSSWSHRMSTCWCLKGKARGTNLSARQKEDQSCGLSHRQTVCINYFCCNSLPQILFDRKTHVVMNHVK